MAKVYGTKNLDVLDFFDGATDGDDEIFGYGGDDWISAGDGNDLLVGGEGADKLNGGDGTDTASYTDSPTGVIVNLVAGVGLNGTAEGDLLFSIENVTGSLFDDFLYGNDYDNVLSGRAGDDTLSGGGGGDVLNGGFGNDTADYSQSSAGVNVELQLSNAWDGDAYDWLISIENVTGSQYDDDLWGDNGANMLIGGSGNDKLWGGEGRDILYGDQPPRLLPMFGGDDSFNGRGDDKLWGLDDADLVYGDGRSAGGNDTLYGDAGTDILVGGMGADVLYGGLDKDIFVWNSSTESTGLTSAGLVTWKMDVITDFNPAEGDCIDLHAIDADQTTSSHEVFTFIGEYGAAGGFTAPGQVAYFYDGNYTYVFLNTDGNFINDFEMAIGLPGQPSLDASAFIFT